MPPMRLEEFIQRQRRATAAPKPARLLALDPGETTGWALFEGHTFVDAGQYPVHALKDFALFFIHKAPTVIVMENYRIYAHRAAQHVGSDVPTVQYIGAVKLAAEMADIPVHLQMAYQAKGFVTDARLQQLGLYQEGRRHANDAVRHAVYYFLFGRT